MIEASAPGKLFVAGEYAVVSPGQPAVLVAVDRLVTVTATPTEGGTGRFSNDRDGGRSVEWGRSADGSFDFRGPVAGFSYLAAAAGVVEDLARGRGIPLPAYELSVRTSLNDVSGHKLGLGSSAAVTVAAIAAVARLLGLELTREQTLKLALLSTWSVNPAASGGDLAAAVEGGWVYYRSPDRAWVAAEGARRLLADLLAAEWPGLELRTLAPPPGLELLVGWTGEPASTIDLVGAVGAHAADPAFLGASGDAVEALARACDAADAGAAEDAVRRARDALRGLAFAAGVAIETPELALLADAAERAGAVGKSSGAGGGDCGIALVVPGTDVAALLRAWEDGGVTPLDLRVEPGGVRTTDRGAR